MRLTARITVDTSSAFPALSHDLTAVLKLTVVGSRPAFLMSPSKRSVFWASPFLAHADSARLKLSRSGRCLRHDGGWKRGASRLTH